MKSGLNSLKDCICPDKSKFNIYYEQSENTKGFLLLHLEGEGRNSLSIHHKKYLAKKRITEARSLPKKETIL